MAMAPWRASGGALFLQTRLEVMSCSWSEPMRSARSIRSKNVQVVRATWLRRFGGAALRDLDCSKFVLVERPSAASNASDV